MSDTSGLGAAGQFVADGGLGEAAAVVGEQELGGLSGAGMGQRLAGRAGGRDAVDESDGLVVEGDEDPKPFIWHKTSEEILASIGR